MTKSKPLPASQSFNKQLKAALRAYHNPQKLGDSSPLASPYFLSSTLQSDQEAATAQGRGQALAREIRAAAETLWTEGELPSTLEEMRQALNQVRQTPDVKAYSFIVLELRVFHCFLRPRSLSDIWENDSYLPGSRTEHYRDFNAAIAHLGDALLARLQPTLRAEVPMHTAIPLGYDRQCCQIRQALVEGKSVALYGPGGIGKSTVAAAVVSQLDRPSFLVHDSAHVK